MGIKHNFTSGKSDSADTSLVNPSNWNADHTIDGDVAPDTDDSYGLGTSSAQWADLYLADVGEIHWNNDTTFNARVGSAALAGSWPGGTALLDFGDTTAIYGAGSRYSAFTLKSTNSGTGGAYFNVEVDDNGTGTAWGCTGYRDNSAGTPTNMGDMNLYVLSDTAGSEDSQWKIQWADSGTTRRFLLQGAAISSVANDTLALGTSSLGWSDLFLADGGIIDWGNNGAEFYHSAATDSLIMIADPNATTASTTLELGTDGQSILVLQTGSASPKTNDVAALGTSSLGWSDLYLADGGVINFGNGGATITHSATEDRLQFSIDSANALSSTEYLFDVDGTTRVALDNTALYSNSNDLMQLGYPLSAWADLYLADGGTINANNGENTITFGALGAYAASAMLFDGTGQGTFPEFCFYNDGAGTDCNAITFWANSASPADQDFLGDIEFYGEDSAGGINLFGQMHARSYDVTNTTEDGVVEIRYMSSGTTHRGLVLGAYDLDESPNNATDGWSLYSSINYGGGNFVNESDGTGGTYINIKHNDGTPADNSGYQAINFQGRDDADNTHTWSEIFTWATDVTDGTESNALIIRARYAGSGSSGDSKKIQLYSGPEGTVGSSTQTASMVFDTGANDYDSCVFYTDAAGTGPAQLTSYKDTASPADNDVVGKFESNGNDSAGNKTNYGNYFVVSEDVTNATEDHNNSFYGLKAGSLGYVIRFSSIGGTYTPEATGGGKGAGRSNWDAVYDDNTLLTCYVDEAVKTGDVDLARWDGFAEDPWDEYNEKPRKRHIPARRFKARLGTEYDPTTLKGQRKHLADKKHLTSYPNPDNYEEETRPSIGQWVQSGVEMDELLFEYIQQLEDRLEALEGA